MLLSEPSDDAGLQWNQHHSRGRSGDSRGRRPSAAHAPARACRTTRLQTCSPTRRFELEGNQDQDVQLWAVASQLEKDQRTRVASALQARPESR